MSHETTPAPGEGGEDVFAVIKRGMGRPAVVGSAIDIAPVRFSVAHGERVTLTDDEKGAQAVSAAMSDTTTVASVTNSINTMQGRLEWLEAELKPRGFDPATGAPQYHRDELNRANLARDAEQLREELGIARMTLEVVHTRDAERRQQKTAELEREAAIEYFAQGDSSKRAMVEEEMQRIEARHLAERLVHDKYKPKR